MPRKRRDAVVRFRATAEEIARWQAAADADQRTLSDWIRVMANGVCATKTLDRDNKKGRQ